MGVKRETVRLSPYLELSVIAHPVNRPGPAEDSAIVFALLITFLALGLPLGVRWRLVAGSGQLVAWQFEVPPFALLPGGHEGISQQRLYLIVPPHSPKKLSQVVI